MSEDLRSVEEKGLITSTAAVSCSGAGFELEESGGGVERTDIAARNTSITAHTDIRDGGRMLPMGRERRDWVEPWEDMMTLKEC